MASGDSLVCFTPHNQEPIGSNYATLDLRNHHPVLDFDDSTNEHAMFTAVMPQNYSGGNLAVYIHWAMTSAVAGDVDWNAYFERIGDQIQDIDSDGFAAPQIIDNNTVPGTCGHVDVVSIPFTQVQADSVAAGELFRLKVVRDATGDTASGDAEVVAVEIREA